MKNKNKNRHRGHVQKLTARRLASPHSGRHNRNVLRAKRFYDLNRPVRKPSRVIAAVAIHSLGYTTAHRSVAMVYYYTSAVVDPPGFIYVGKDKFENEDLIKFGWDEDVWYAYILAKLPKTAHIYLRMNEGQQWDSLPENLVMDLAHLTKANSIEGSSCSLLTCPTTFPADPTPLPGNKKDNITVIYTPWSNLKKDGSMDIGQVSFKNPRLVKRVLVAQRENVIVNRLNKTKTEVKQPDFKQQKDDHDKEIRRKANAALQIKKKEEARQAQEWKEKKWQKEHAYDDLFTEENMDMQSNQNRSEDWEDDFM
ncbi:hypothetical protein G3M48_005247 [Beauveria asiatica]|uniref:NFACT RNA-binding domain-containing protein n=1 Tax=Beauveria asiatica TaxID=1069075 RepID=A0AAW0RS29_9HYPO